MIGFLSRLISIILSYIAACLIAGVVLWLGFLIAEWFADRSTAGLGPALIWIMNKGVFSATTIALVAAFPAAIFIVLAEWKDIGNWAYFALAGLVLGMVMAYVLRTSELTLAAGTDPSNVPVFAVSGLLGGLTYWLLAGVRD